MTAPRPASAVNLAVLKRDSVRGGVVTLVSQGISTGVHLVSTVVLARLLSPEDFGVMSMVAAITAFASLFRDLGLSTAAVQKGELTRDLQSNLFWINVALGTGLTGLLAAASPLVAWFYGRPELAWVTVALSFNFVISSLGTQHGVLLTRRMQFGRKAAAGIGGSIVGLVVSILLARLGYRYWALVWGGLSSAVVSVLLLFAVSPFRPGWPRRGTGVLGLVRFGANVTAFNIVNYFHRNLDNLLIGKVWGAEALGLYSRAYALLMFPIQAIRNPLNAVAFPALGRLQNDHKQYRIYYCRLTQLTAFLSMPLSALLFSGAAPLIELLLGPKWLDVVPIFRLLAAVAFIQPVQTLWGVVLLSLGMAQRYFYLGVLNSVLTVLGFVAGLAWGPIGVAAGYAMVTYITAYPILTLAFRDTPLRISDILENATRPAIAALSGMLVCTLGSQAMPAKSEISPAVLLLILWSLFLAAYLLTFLVLPGGKNDLCWLWKLLRERTASLRRSALHIE
jgi:PST family polysaccharide transporter